MIDTDQITKTEEKERMYTTMLESEDWKKFFEFLMAREDRSVTNDPRDPGKQTAWGISRKYHPNCDVWELVDKGITKGPEFERRVSKFYSNMLFKYWYLFDRKLREVFCDSYVNMGLGKPNDANLDAAELLQKSLNLLAGSEYVKIDGDIGKNTKLALKAENHTALAYTMIALRFSEYRRRGLGKMAWAREGWLNRVDHLLAYISLMK